MKQTAGNLTVPSLRVCDAALGAFSRLLSGTLWPWDIVPVNWEQRRSMEELHRIRKSPQTFDEKALTVPTNNVEKGYENI